MEESHYVCVFLKGQSIVWEVLAVAVLSGSQTICNEGCLHTCKSVFACEEVIMGTLLSIYVSSFRDFQGERTLQVWDNASVHLCIPIP